MSFLDGFLLVAVAGLIVSVVFLLARYDSIEGQLAWHLDEIGRLWQQVDDDAIGKGITPNHVTFKRRDQA